MNRATKSRTIESSRTQCRDLLEWDDAVADSASAEEPLEVHAIAVKPTFSTRGVLACTFLVCVWVAAFSAPDPFPFPIAVIATLLVGVALTACSLRTRTQRGLRVFCFGAIIGLVLSFWPNVAVHYSVHQDPPFHLDEEMEAYVVRLMCIQYRQYLLFLPIAVGVGGSGLLLARWSIVQIEGVFKPGQLGIDRTRESHRREKEEN